jgi:hypothetical protein
MVEEGAAEELEIDTQTKAAELPKLPEQEAIEPATDASEARLNGRLNGRLNVRLNDRFDALVQTTSERLARRIGRSGHLADKDILLISQALAVPLERVQLWAKSQSPETLDQKRLTQSLISLGLNL